SAAPDVIKEEEMDDEPGPSGTAVVKEDEEMADHLLPSVCTAKDASTLIQLESSLLNVTRKFKRSKMHCSECSFFALQPMNLYSHVRNTHPEEFVRLSSPCPHCDYRAMDAQLLESHLNWFLCLACSANVPQCQKRLHVGTGTPKTRLCFNKRCKIRFNNDSDWVNHMNQKCSLCGKLIPSCMRTAEHMKTCWDPLNRYKTQQKPNRMMGEPMNSS
ncbi:hypothetical protein PMAYCL1PPCAC_05832, partial [Pristionchus mayeri]